MDCQFCNVRPATTTIVAPLYGRVELCERCARQSPRIGAKRTSKAKEAKQEKAGRKPGYLPGQQVFSFMQTETGNRATAARFGI
jgi:hypothetical protein